LPYKPERFAVVDISKNSLTELSPDLRSTSGLYVPEDYMPYLFNFSDTVFEKCFVQGVGFDIVVIFSANKHMRSEKNIFSVGSLL
jgi:hypothetical protein